MRIHEIPWLEPVDAAARLRKLGGLSFLDSAMKHPSLGRYSYVCADPFGRFEVRDRRSFWNGEELSEPPLQALMGFVDRYGLEDVPGVPPFQGGAIGYFAYEFGRLLEELPQPLAPDEGSIADAAWHFHDVVIAFDHQEGKAWLLSSGLPAESGQRSGRAEERARQFLDCLAQPGAPETAIPPIAKAAWRSNFERRDYMDAVGRVVEYILAGDIFQANIAQRFVADLPDFYDSWAFYRKLRQGNPATFAAFLDHGDSVIASSSPERFLKVRGRAVETRPIKGTAPRSDDPVEDAASAELLLNSEKDRAENLMIVDLMRNDLSRVCRPHSVLTPTLCGLESYAVHHLVSVVTGELASGKGLGDLIAASFPGGSITGAPKVRAMEIITEIEKVARGIYCGSIGYIGFNGSFDSNIAIRTVSFKAGRAVLQAGGGITALSDPAAEYQETLDKAARIFAVFAQGAGS
ncbi:aminodeoxychorismate synthase component I [Phyllobacterium sp. 0TCS1.6C]|uniref:aminodeoxychorismate synthase component I n=1 Tax=unclassified Phyllobacterium TaxID=2638441 RepID=UPI002264FBD3|nr:MULTISPECIES: aminodeoxychorismate synthase component I [unclassified Phyllobacterium]MCX8280719.1 aminodeoxychorismate synthase component I [Phyllobacterium sp. 0TCS1.6C]MCX8292704.1 aminodeoxychorismate synthase component I [Phyllobacterium sp. 0TCS1.6A]